VRAPAIVAGLATIPAVYWVGRELAGHRAALVATALVSVSPAMIGWSVYGRGYAFAILFGVLSFGCLNRALSDRGRVGLWRALYVGAALGIAYSNTLALLTLLPVHAFAIGTRAGNLRAFRAWVVAAVALAAGLVPLVVLLYLESTYRDPLAWLWKPDLALVRRVGGELGAGPAYFGTAGPGLALAILAILTAIVVVGVVTSWGRARRPSWTAGVLLTWALFPPVLLLVLSQLRPMFWGRYLGIVVPAFALLVAVLLVRIPRPLALTYGLLLGGLLLTASLTTPAPPNDFRAAGSWVSAQLRPGDPLVLYPIEQLPPVAYYVPALQVEGVVPVEEWNDTRLPPGVEGYRRDYDWGDSPLGPPTARDLARLVARTGSVLVLTYPNLAGELSLGWAEKRGCDVEWNRFDGLLGVSIGGCT
jgi:mannosyltransferase